MKFDMISAYTQGVRSLVEPMHKSTKDLFLKGLSQFLRTRTVVKLAEDLPALSTSERAPAVRAFVQWDEAMRQEENAQHVHLERLETAIHTRREVINNDEQECQIQLNTIQENAEKTQKNHDRVASVVQWVGEEEGLGTRVIHAVLRRPNSLVYELGKQQQELNKIRNNYREWIEEAKAGG